MSTWEHKQSQRRQGEVVEEVGAHAHKIPHTNFKHTNTRRCFVAIVLINLAVPAVQIQLSVPPWFRTLCHTYRAHTDLLYGVVVFF